MPSLRQLQSSKHMFQVSFPFLWISHSTRIGSKSQLRETDLKLTSSLWGIVGIVLKSPFSLQSRNLCLLWGIHNRLESFVTYDQCIECIHSTGSIESHLVSSDKLHGVTNTRSAAEVDITHYNLLGTSSLFDRNSKFWPFCGYDRRTRHWAESWKKVQDLSTRHRSRPLDDVCCL